MDSSGITLPEPNLISICSIIILDNDGGRVVAKYYDKESSLKEQKAFEKNLFKKTHRANGEVLMLDGYTILYRSSVDLFFYVLGGPDENALLLLSILNCLVESISSILRKNVEKRTLLENLDVVTLAIDEICDNGVILEADPAAVVQRVATKPEDIPIGEQTVSQIFQSAREQLKWSILR
ncbi:coatomer subunit zeta-1-like [Panonychus citri]|uniref:coatomer subunit zeta-1-like n=1 Tax=Panonychus citri TaxID=50023 RepID=UPI00230762E6|nr:coatomer subunit zeta-1-like [Panonychus citri]